MLFVIVPAYNEAPRNSSSLTGQAKNIGRVVRDLFELRDGLKQIDNEGFRLIVIDDGSTDDTGKLAREAGATVIHGIEMLLAQGIEQFKMFTGVAAPEDVMRKALTAEIN